MKTILINSSVFEVQPWMRELLEKKGQKLNRLMGGARSIEWYLDKNGSEYVTSLHYLVNGRELYAYASHEDFHKSIDLLVAKIKRILGDYKDIQTNKIHRHYHHEWSA